MEFKAQVYHWVGDKLPFGWKQNEIVTINESQLLTFAQIWDVMIQIKDGMIFILFDEKGRSFRVR